MRLLTWLLVGLVFWPAIGLAQNRGVPQNGFPNWQERMIYVYTNRARADPVTELAGCAGCAEKACYSAPMPPVVWNYNLNRSARFHAGNLEDTGCFQHDSPCTLVPSGVQNVYIPVGTCLGQASCACTDAKQCGVAVTPTFTRIAAFGTSGSAENIAYSSSGSPRSIFNLWIYETDAISTCGFRSSNGHRFSILNPGNKGLGNGYFRITRDMYVQDYASSGTPTGSLITGGHDPQFTTSGTTTINFRVNYYDTRAGPQSAKVNIDGACTVMTKEQGVALTNATWLAALPLAGSTCRRYVFEFQDPAGVTVRLPETGSYGLGASLAACADWTSAAPPSCPAGGNQPPTVATAAAATANPTGTSTTALSVLGADDGGEPALLYTWSATGPAAVAFSTNGTNASKASTATFSAAGSYVVTATVTDAQNLAVTSVVNVTVSQTLTSVVVAPPTASVSVGGSQQFNASGKDQFGATLTSQPTFSWMTTGGGTVSGSGLFTAGTGAGGPFTITATSGTKSATASVTVTAASGPTVATAAAASPNPVTANSAAVSVLGADDGGEAALVYTWSATGPSAVAFSANASNAAKASTATFSAAGAYVVTVAIKDAQNQTTTSTVNVSVNQTLTTVTVSPASASVIPLGTQQFAASGKDQFGAAMTIQPAFSWTTTGGGTVSGSGVYTAGGGAGGPFDVTATFATKSGSGSITVTSGSPPTVATAAAANPSPVASNTTALTVLGADDGGEAALIYTWSATGPAGVAFSPNGTNGGKSSTATFTAAGAYTLTVTIKDAQNQTVISTVQVTVSQTLSTIAVTPAPATLGVGTTQQFVATARDQFGAALITQPTFTWMTTGGGTVNGVGLFTAAAAPGGPFTLTASSGGKSGTASVTISAGNAPTIASAAAAGPNPVLATTTALTVLGADDGGEAALTYTWTATGPSAVSFSPNGTNSAKTSAATFTRAGSYVLTVTIRDAGNQTVTTTVNVTVQQTLTTVAIAPATAAVVVNATRQFAASGKDQFGDLLATQPAFTWAVNGGGSISAAGLFTAAAATGGPFIVSGTSATKSGTASLTVTAGNAPTVATAAAATPNPVLGSTSALTVLGADDGGEGNLTYSWNATGPAAVLWSINGTHAASSVTATFGRAGSYQVTVTITDAGGQTTTSTVTITVQQVLAAISVMPASTAVATSSSLTFLASASDQFGNALSTQPSFTWMANGGGSITPGGLFTAGAAVGGPFTLTASSGGKSGTAAVSVISGAAPTVAAAAAASPNPVLATTTSLTVLGADDAGEAALSYTWSSTGPAPVTFSANGANAAKTTVATFIAAGSYTFTATIKDVQNLAVLSSVGVAVQPTATLLSVSPPVARVLVGASLQFSATVVDQFGGPLSPQPTIAWSVGGGGSISTSGVFAAASPGGPFTITASAGGNSGSAQVTVDSVPDVTPPLVALIEPLEGATVSGIVKLEATASDDSMIAKVEFFVDGSSVGAATAAPWTSTWSSVPAAVGSHRLLARATDSSGNLAESMQVTVMVADKTFDRIAPTVKITSPINASIMESTLIVTAEAADQVGVTSVRFFLDGAEVGALTQLPWTVTLEAKRVGVGSHVLRASAFDAAGNRGDSAPVAF